ncbi:hypothetical protein F924_02629 [Acinetobacter lwoffii ATCC 9957 = CIP 70.31]|nr:hypothetical protein F924_02629 [Acinetobacter lwoffii ATCC 9957 = CIP 70.31]
MSELKQYPVIYEQTVAWGDKLSLKSKHVFFSELV